MSRLLNRLELNEESLLYVGKIQPAFRNPASRTGKPSGATDSAAAAASNGRHLIDPLTKREQEILGLLSNDLTNMEIAKRLFISKGTVKRHTNSIYSKLAVHGRREAVVKATGLGILS